MRTVFFVALLVCVFFFVQHEDQKAQNENLDLYCLMVDAFKQNPRYGWPDYKGVYLEQCFSHNPRGEK